MMIQEEWGLKDVFSTENTVLWDTKCHLGESAIYNSLIEEFEEETKNIYLLEKNGSVLYSEDLTGEFITQLTPEEAEIFSQRAT